MLLIELQSSKSVWILVDPDGMKDDTFTKGTRVEYTYDDGERCVGRKSRGERDDIQKLQTLMKDGYFSLAWNDRNIWFVFADKICKINNPTTNNELKQIHQYASEQDIPKKYLSKEFVKHYTSQILENVVRGKFEQRLRSKKGMYKHPDIEVPPGYDRFEAHRTNHGGKIVGFKGERSSVVSTTSSFELADALASAYNAGGYTDKKIEKVPLDQFFK